MGRGSTERAPLALAVLAILIGGLHLGGLFRTLDDGLADLRFRLLRRPASGELAVVAVDPRSLRALDVWPWPRGYHATVVENLLAAGARRVAFDIDFSSRSIAEEDRELERALEAAAGRVVLAVFQQWEREGSGAAVLTTTAPLPVFARHAELGSINIRPEPDGRVRRYGGQEGRGGLSTPSFAAALIGSGAPYEDGFYMDFAILPDSVPRISFVDALTGAFDAKLVAGRAVIVGATAVELGDQSAVPVYAALPGPLVQALAVESMVQGRVLRPAGHGATLGGVILLTALLGPWLLGAPWVRAWPAVGLVVVVAFAVSVVIQGVFPLIPDVAAWMAVPPAVHVLALVRRVDRQSLLLFLQGLRIRRAEILLRHVVEGSLDPVVTLSGDGRVQGFNPAAEAVFGRGAPEILGRPASGLVVPAPGASEAATDLFRPGRGPIEAAGRRGDGTTFPVELSVIEVAGDEARRRVVFVRDITERKAHESVLEHEARHDALTGLPNRVLLRERAIPVLRRAQERGERAALILLDLDRFKEINDTLGHGVGDRLLQQLAGRLRAAITSAEAVSRLGGDEFAVLLSEADVRGAREAASRLLQAVGQPFELEGLSLQVDASLGIAVFPDDSRDVDELLQHADVAMYVAKRSRSTLAFYDAELDRHSVRQLTLRGELRRAIEEGHLILHYQPKVGCAGDRIVGVEALVRWRHPLLGILPPDDFIELAEHGGLIGPLTDWVLGASLDQTARWRSCGAEVAVSVNLSARNLLQEDMPRRVKALLAERALPPHVLTCEITETVLMEDPARALGAARSLADLGVRIAIDDFGTGYSSLSYLKRLPAAEVKIDKSFVMRMDSDRDDAVIVGSTIEMAHHLGLAVVAEGVESERVWRRLKELRCDYGQGYLFSPPVPAEGIESLLRSTSWETLSRWP